MTADNDSTGMFLDSLLRDARSVTISRTPDGDFACVVHRASASIIGGSTVVVKHGADPASAVENAAGNHPAEKRT
jgi:hypothetical protein